RDFHVTGVQTCALPIWVSRRRMLSRVALDPRRSWEGDNGIYKESVFGSYLAERAQIAPNAVVTDGTLTSLAVSQTAAQAGRRERSEERRVGAGARQGPR